jgi:MFS family permease
MSELKSHPVSPGVIAVTERAVNGVPVRPEPGRHRSGRQLGTGSGERKVPHDRTDRLRLLAGSAIGVGFLFVAHWLAPEQGSLLAAPSGAVGWIAMICGIAGVWLVPGLWISAVIVRVGAGPVAWLGTRISTTLAWYAVVGPVIHHAGQGARVTTLGILTLTTAATAAVSLGVAFGLSCRPADRWLRILLAAVVGGGCAQVVIWASSLMWSDNRIYSHNLAVDGLIVLGCALLVAVGTLRRPNLPPVLTVRNIRTPLIAVGVFAITAAALLAMGSRWSPAQRMPSAFAAEQIPAPAGADVAFSLTAIGQEGSELIRRADFTGSDDTGRPVPVDTRLVLADGTADRATLFVVLPRSSQSELCGDERGEEQWVRAFKTGAPVKLTVRDQASGLLLQAVIPLGWCTA